MSLGFKRLKHVVNICTTFPDIKILLSYAYKLPAIVSRLVTVTQPSPVVVNGSFDAAIAGSIPTEVMDVRLLSLLCG